MDTALWQVSSRYRRSGVVNENMSRPEMNVQCARIRVESSNVSGTPALYLVAERGSMTPTQHAPPHTGALT